MDDKEPTKEPWQPEWGFWAMVIFFILMGIYVMSNGIDGSGPACDLVRGC